MSKTVTKQVVGQPRYLKEINKTIVERFIVRQGPLTKPQLAQLSGLSLPTVNKIVDQLEAQNKVCCIGTAGDGVGRRARLYQTNEDSGNVLTVYISQGVMTCCVVNMAGVIIYRFSVNLEGRDAGQALLSAVERMLQNCSAPPVAIGVGLPGVVDDQGAVSLIPGIPAWEGLSLRSQLEQRFGIPVCVENNVRLTALGFYNERLRSDYQDVVYLHVGQGLSCGIILGGRPYKGFTSFAGELGYMVLSEDQGADQETSGRLEQTLAELIQSYRSQQDPQRALEIRSRFHDYLARILCNFICVLNPQVVVLRGSMISGESLGELRERLARLLPERGLPQLLLDTSDFSSLKGIVAACRQVAFPSLDIVKNGSR